MTTVSPNPCSHSQLVYFPGTSSLVLMNSGSYPGIVGPSLQTWQFSSNNWALTNAGLGTNPTPRIGFGAAYDGTALVVFGGAGTSGSAFGFYNDTNTYNGTTWTTAIANDGYNNNLTGRKNPYLFSLSTGVLLFGGQDILINKLETWIWTHSSQAWTLQAPAASPSIRIGAASCSNGTNAAVLFGGANGSFMLNDLWVYTTGSTNWTQLTSNTGPSCRTGACMAWSPALSAFILFGGSNSEGRCLNDTWSMTISGTVATWTKLALTSNPSVRCGAMMAYDTASSQLILFGGKNSANLLNDTFVLTNTTTGWTAL